MFDERDRALDEYNDEELFSKDFLYKIKSSEGSKLTREIGNKLFNSKNHSKLIHEEILITYSKSIALAPNNSEELALAFGNRSILLLHLGKYQESIIDCDYALKFKVESQLFKPKILCRKVLCFTKLNKKIEAKKTFDEAKILIDKIDDKSAKSKLLKNLNDSVNTKLLDQPPNKFRKNVENSLPYLSNAISWENNEMFGNHLVSNTTIESGEIILIDKAYCTYPKLKKIYTVCSHCLKQLWNGIPCDNCVFVMYCSDHCKNEAWEKYHDVECEMYPFLFHNMTDSEELFLLRLFIKALKEIGIEELIREVELDELETEKSKTKFSQEEILSKCNTYKFCNHLFTKKEWYGDDLKIAENTVLFILAILKDTPISIKYNLESYNESKIEKILYKLRSMCYLNNFDLEIPEYHKLSDSAFDYMDITISLGIIMNSISCFFNHSCYPNVDIVKLEGGKTIFYATRPIDKNEQLFITYGPLLTKDPADRKAILKRKYDFLCDCIPCQKNWPVAKNAQTTLKSNEIMNSFKMHLEKKKHLFALSIREDRSWLYREDAIKIISDCIDFLTPYISIPEISDLIVSCFINYLYIGFHINYGSDFDIPKDCIK